MEVTANSTTIGVAYDRGVDAAESVDKRPPAVCRRRGREHAERLMRDRPEQGDRQQPVKNKQDHNHRVGPVCSGHARPVAFSTSRAARSPDSSAPSIQPVQIDVCSPAK